MTRIARRAGVVAALVTTSALVTAVPAVSAPALDQAEAVVDLDEEGTAQVEIDYVVTGGAEGEEPTETVSFSALAFHDTGGVPVEDVTVTTSDGQELDTSIETVELKTTATATLAEPLPPGGQTALTVSYTATDVGVIDGERMTADVPVLALDLPAATTSSGIFTASMLLAPGYDHIEGFPANPESVGTSGDRDEVVYDTPAVPSLLRSVSTTGDTPLFTLERTVDLILLVTLLAGGVALYFSFTRGRRRAAEVEAATSAPAGPSAPASRERRH